MKGYAVYLLSGGLVMHDVGKLTKEERVFLAGCIRAVTMADGSIEEGELEDIDSILKKLKFRDYEECLVEFEENIKDEESFYEYARRIKNKDARDIILKTIYELSLQDGLPEESEENIFNRLNRIWQENQEK